MIRYPKSFRYRQRSEIVQSNLSDNRDIDDVVVVVLYESFVGSKHIDVFAGTLSAFFVESVQRIIRIHTEDLLIYILYFKHLAQSEELVWKAIG